MSKRDDYDCGDSLYDYIAPADAHLADQSGPSVEERINPGPDEIVPADWAEERERQQRMLGTLILSGFAFLFGFLLGTWL